jgi:Cu(I)/Ag(I) efflux system membrane fusion protein
MNGKIIMVFALALTGVAATAYWLGSRSIPAVSNTAQATQTERKVLYYRNPMGLPDTSTVPKQDAMGMDYVPVYADEEQASSNVVISSDKVQKLGVTSEEIGRAHV